MFSVEETERPFTLSMFLQVAYFKYAKKPLFISLNAKRSIADIVVKFKQIPNNNLSVTKCICITFSN